MDTKRKSKKTGRAASTRKPKPENRLRKRGNNPNPPPPPKEYQFRPGQSGNPGGRPKSLSGAYKKFLESVNDEDPLKRTNAELIALALGLQALDGNVQAAREMRAATEGERIRTWRDDVIELLRNGEITPDKLREELGNDEIFEELVATAGIRRNERRGASEADEPKTIEQPLVADTSG